MNLLLLGNLGTGELIIIALIILLLFGAARIPALMRSMGQGVKNFKEGVKGIEDEIKTDDVKKTVDEVKKETSSEDKK